MDIIIVSNNVQEVILIGNNMYIFEIAKQISY